MNHLEHARTSLGNGTTELIVCPRESLSALVRVCDAAVDLLVNARRRASVRLFFPVKAWMDAVEGINRAVIEFRRVVNETTEEKAESSASPRRWTNPLETVRPLLKMTEEGRAVLSLCDTVMSLPDRGRRCEEWNDEKSSSFCTTCRDLVLCAQIRAMVRGPRADEPTRSDSSYIRNLVNRLQAPGRPGDALSASEFEDLTTWAESVLDSNAARRMTGAPDSRGSSGPADSGEHEDVPSEGDSVLSGSVSQ